MIRVGCLCLISAALFAQVNVERYRSKSATTCSAIFSVTDSATSKNETWAVDGLLNRILGKHEWLVVGGLGYGKLDDQRTEDDHFMHGRHFWHLRESSELTWGPESFAQSQSNAFSNQERRTLFGVGARCVVNRELKSFRGGLSIMREEIHLKDTDPLWFTRANAYLNFTSKLWSVTAYYQPELDNFSNANLVFDGSLQFSINDKIKFETRLSANRNTTLNVDDRSITQAIRLVI